MRSWLEISALRTNSLSPGSTNSRSPQSQASQADPYSLEDTSHHGLNPTGRSFPASLQPCQIPNPGLVLAAAETAEDHSRPDMEPDPLASEPLSNPALFTSDTLEFEPSPHVARLDTEAPKAPEHLSNFPLIDCAEGSESGRIPTSNAAIAIYLRQCADVETASLAATLGSQRRRSCEADSSSIAGRDRYGANVLDGPSGASQASFFNRLLRNAKKRKDGQSDDSAQVSGGAAPNEIEPQDMRSPLKRVMARPRSPRSDVSNPHQHQHPTSRTTSNRRTLKALHRIRSRNDPNATVSNASNTSNNASTIAQSWARQSGPPVSSPIPSKEKARMGTYHEPRAPIPTLEDADLDDEALPDSSSSAPMRIGEAPVAATQEAFVTHIQKLNPVIERYMVQRLVAEQEKRYRRLVDARAQHDAAIQRHTCATGGFCNRLGEGPRYPSPSATRLGDSNPPIFWVSHGNATVDNPDDGERAHFPEGIPIPPVSRLPAEFECPLCFQVKKIIKPSDWTKHVNEDIQPFTCTFPECSEAKSFKRKADWVRHEVGLSRFYLPAV